MAKLGTLTISGTAPTGIGGFQIGEKHRIMRFEITEKGFIRSGLLYPTFDPEVIIRMFQLKDAKYSLKYRI